MPPDAPAATTGPLSAPSEGGPDPGLAGPGWRVIPTPYTGEAHARGEKERASLNLGLAAAPLGQRARVLEGRRRGLPPGARAFEGRRQGRPPGARARDDSFPGPPASSPPQRARVSLTLSIHPFPGLAARTPLPRGALIEASPCLTISPDEYAAHGEGVRALACYAFSDPARSGAHLLALGCGSLFNHARAPSVDYRVDFKNATIRFYAARDIAAGEELTISYGRVWWEEGKGEGIPGAPGDPSHDHMDDEDAFLGAIGLGEEGEDARVG